MATLTFTGTGTAGTNIEDLDATDSPNSGRGKLNNNLKRLTDGINAHEDMLVGVTGGIADLDSAQSFNNKIIVLKVYYVII